MTKLNSSSFLNGSLLYQMSLGSKELYHSNVWWWLINNDKEFIKVFIPNFDIANFNNGDFILPERESHNRDILIWCKDNKGSKFHIVIENKIKSLPSIEQLNKYTTSLYDNEFLCGILTGIGECPFELPEKWSYVSYNSISVRIRNVLSETSNKIIIEHKEQILEYCDIIDAINDLLDSNLKRNSNILSYQCDRDLYDLRIGDVFKKHKASQFVRYIKSRKDELDIYKPNDYNFYIAQGFNNGKATIDIRFSNWKSDYEKYNLLGVQIEGDQFRIVAEKNIKLEGITSDDIFDKYNDVWFDSSYDRNSKNRLIHNHKTSMKTKPGKKYDMYNTNNYCFIYQYFNISNDNYSFDELFNLIKHYIDLASKIIKKQQ